MSFFVPVDITQSSMVGQERLQISELQFDKFPTPSSSNFMLDDKIQKPGDYLFRFYSKGMLWTKEVEMVDSMGRN